MKRAVKSAGVSQSRWIAEVILEKVHGEWPADVAALADCFRPLPDCLCGSAARAARNKQNG